MFSKTSKVPVKPQASVPAPSKSNPPSLVSADLHITGNLESDGEIHVYGTIDGDIKTKVLVIGETANITGGTVADTVHVHGNVNGEIKARSVNLAKTAHVVGDILHEDLSIDAGAFLEGHCRRIIEKKDPGNTADKPGPDKPSPADVKSGPDAVKSGTTNKISAKAHSTGGSGVIHRKGTVTGTA